MTPEPPVSQFLISPPVMLKVLPLLVMPTAMPPRSFGVVQF